MSFDRGLKMVSQDVAVLLGMSAGELYETQRSLVRRGVIQSRPGRGPNSGAEASPENISILLVEYFSTHPAEKLVSARDAAIKNSVRLA